VQRHAGQRFGAADARALATAPDGPEVRAARHSHARARAQRGQLQRLRRGARAPVATLPFAFEDGPERVAHLARALERSL
jgi:hypothetical protein